MPVGSTGKYCLKEQIGGWGIFADIELMTIRRAEGMPLVTLECGLCDDESGRYVAAIGFGAAYAFHCVAESNDLGVIVTRLHTNPVDTTPMALAFATCHAVLKSLGLESTSAPDFDRQTRSFVFPGRLKME